MTRDQARPGVRVRDTSTRLEGRIIGDVDILGCVLVAFDPDAEPGDRIRVAIGELERIHDGWESWT